MHSMTQTPFAQPHKKRSDLVDDRPEAGIFQVHRDAYADPAILDLEMEWIFERSWSFLGFDAQLPNISDFLTTHIGRVPILVTRDASGKVNAFINACRHKGLKLCVEPQGNARNHVCPYHGWTYDAAGKNVLIKDMKEGDYPDAFLSANHDLLALPKLASYKGLLFGSLNADVPSLEDYLGDMKFFIDLAMDQGPNGMEPIPGRISYTYRGNWKMQFDNGLDSYHLTSTHSSFMNVLTRRQAGQGSAENTQVNFAGNIVTESATFSFPYGHSAVTVEGLDVTRRPIYSKMEEVRARVGDLKAHWMLQVYNSLVFPNLQIANNSALILRVIRPLAVDLTEMTAYCLGAIGESTTERTMRLRAFEDFYNSSGMATPDDISVYERCQQGMASKDIGWLQGYARGMSQLTPGANALATSLKLTPLDSTMGTLKTGQEQLLHAPYREWARLLEAGQTGQPSY